MFRFHFVCVLTNNSLCFAFVANFDGFGTFDEESNNKWCAKGREQKLKNKRKGKWLISKTSYNWMIEKNHWPFRMFFDNTRTNFVVSRWPMTPNIAICCFRVVDSNFIFISSLLSQLEGLQIFGDSECVHTVVKASTHGFACAIHRTFGKCN